MLLHTRRLLLEAKGYAVTSALGFSESLYHCKQGGFDLFILGHSIPENDKQALIEGFRKSCSGPIVSLTRGLQPHVVGADYYIDPDPQNVLKLVDELLGSKEVAQRP